MDVTKVGMASVEPKVATYTEFAEVVLPRIKRHPGSEWLPCRSTVKKSYGSGVKNGFFMDHFKEDATFRVLNCLK
jgi:hypothetical protein